VSRDCEHKEALPRRCAASLEAVHPKLRLQQLTSRPWRHLLRLTRLDSLSKSEFRG